jgi:hypothetical protein
MSIYLGVALITGAASGESDGMYILVYIVLIYLAYQASAKQQPSPSLARAAPRSYWQTATPTVSRGRSN